MSSFDGRVAAVTGAASGIGRALAVGLARRGARLALADVDRAGLAATADDVAAAGGQVTTTVVDVSDRGAVADWAAEVRAHHGAVHQIYNNAGIASSSHTLLEADYAEIERLLAINLWGVIHGTKEFLPHLVASGAGHVVNLSSLNGFMAQAGATSYCTSKFAVRGFTESVRAEMVLAKQPVAVTVVHPGGVKTNIATSVLTRTDRADAARYEAERRRAEVYNEKLFTTTAADAAEQILRGVERNRPRVLIGQARAVDRLVRLLPGAYPRVVAAWDRRTFGRSHR